MDWLLELAKYGSGPAVIIGFLQWSFARLRDDVSAIKGRMDCFEKSQHICQLDIAKNYATKDEFGDLEDRVNKHESRISRLEGRK